MKKANGATKQLVQVVVANTMVIFATIMKICRGIVFFISAPVQTSSVHEISQYF